MKSPMTTWERIRFNGKTVILRNPTETVMDGLPVITGIEVNVEDVEVAARGTDERRHIIDLGLVTKRTPLKMNNHYGLLEDSD